MPAGTHIKKIPITITQTFVTTLRVPCIHELFDFSTSLITCTYHEQLWSQPKLQNCWHELMHLEAPTKTDGESQGPNQADNMKCENHLMWNMENNYIT
jgi:hypothetical protein